MVSGIINKSLITTDIGHKEESLNMEAGENHKSAENSMAQTENNVSFIRHDYAVAFLQGLNEILHYLGYRKLFKILYTVKMKG
jgi:hypothetical protein